jgi:hypothetical protein
LKTIAKFQFLQELSIGGNDLTNSCVADLSPLKKLKCLSMSKANISDQSLNGLSNLNNLSFLDVSYNKINGDFLLELKTLKNFLSLFAKCTILRLDNFKEFPVAHSLCHLDLTSIGISDPDLNYLTKIRNLRFLSIYYNNIDGNGLKPLADLKTLEYLAINLDSFKLDNLKNLSAIKNLKRIDALTDGKNPDFLKELLSAIPKNSLLNIFVKQMPIQGEENNIFKLVKK